MRWVLVGIIGSLTGIVAFLINFAVRNLINVKLELFDRSMPYKLEFLKFILCYQFFVL